MPYKLSDIQPNPFRIGRIDDVKVDALVESINTTSFWDNIVARIGKDGKPELAYGHHRLAALKKAYPLNHEINLIIRELDDATMIQIMARENDEDYGNDALATVHSVRATVLAYARGLIPAEKMPLPKRDTKKQYLRYAPSFVAGEPASNLLARPYTVDSIATFLGKRDEKGNPSDAMYTALNALELMERELLSNTQIEGKNMSQLERIVTAKRKLREDMLEREREAERAKQEAEKFKQQAAEAEKKRLEFEAQACEAAKQQAKQEHVDKLNEKAEAQKAKEDRANERAAIQEREAKHKADEAEILEQVAKETVVEAKTKRNEAQLSMNYLVTSLVDRLNNLLVKDALGNDFKELLKRDKEITAEYKIYVNVALDSVIDRIKKLQEKI